MSNTTSRNANEKIKSYLNATLQMNHNGSCGWGRVNTQTVSIVNTVEALLALREVNALDGFLCGSQAIQVGRYLHHTIQNEIEKPISTTRYIAYGVIGLDIFKETKLMSVALERLLQSACDGGWSSTSEKKGARLIPTFQAMFALRQVREVVEDKHYKWLIDNHFKPGGLCSFTNCHEESIGASCLVLYLLAKGAFGDRVQTILGLGNTLQPHLKDVFIQMAGSSEKWVSHDPESNFKVFGYGFGMRGLCEAGLIDFDKVGVDKFVEALSSAFSSTAVGSSSHALSCDPAHTWTPAVLELAIALRTLQDSFDPLKFYSEQKLLPVITSGVDQITVERELKEIELKQIMLVAQEREIIKRDNLLEQLDVKQKSLVEHIDQKLNSAQEKVLTSLAASIGRLVKQVLLLIAVGIFLLISIFCIAISILYPEVGGTIADVLAIVSFAITVITFGFFLWSTFGNRASTIPADSEKVSQSLKRL